MSRDLLCGRWVLVVCMGSREGIEGPDPPEKSQCIGFLSNTGLDPLKNHKTTKPAFTFEWRFAGGPVMARL